MSTLKITLFVLIALATTGAMNTTNFTCLGNPYFNTPYNPDPITPGTTNQTILDLWNVTYDNSTGIYNFTNYTGLTFCQQLKETGSCCAPDFLNESAQAYGRLFNASNEATVHSFNKRVGKLKDYGKVYGKIFGTLINLISRGHEVVFKILKKLDRIASDGTTLDKVLKLVNVTNATEFFSNYSSEIANVTTDPNKLLNLTFQLVTIVADKAGIGKGEIVNFFGSLKAMQMVFSALPSNLFASTNMFPSVDKALISDTTDKWQNILTELANRTTNITLTLNLNPTPVKKLLRFLENSQTLQLNVSFALILDARNVEAITKAMKEAIKDAKNATQLFNILLNKSDEIYKNINNSWVSDQKSLDDFKFGGSWGQFKELITKIGTFVFDDALKKVVTVAENKKNCLKLVFKYQGYIGCLACDASALALGKIKLNETAKKFSPVISRTFGEYVSGNCTAYIRDLIFMNSFLQSLKALKRVNDIDDLSKKGSDKINDDVSEAPVSNKTIDDELDIPCSLDDSNCTWIQNNILDGNGPTLGLLCDYSTDDCDDEDDIKEMRRPNVKKNSTKPEKKDKEDKEDKENTEDKEDKKGKDGNKRLLEESSSTSSVEYSSTEPDQVSSNEGGFETQPNYTIDKNATEDATVDPTPDVDTSNSSNSTNNTKLALKQLVSIPLILASILVFLF